MAGGLDAGVHRAFVELTTHLGVEGQRDDSAREMDARDDRSDPFDRRDVVVLMISIAILGFGMLWVAPW